MTGWLMRRMEPGGFAWLTLHELRLARAARSGKRWATALALVLLAIWIVAGIAIAYALRTVPIHASAMGFTGAAAGAILVFSFMTTQAMLGSQRTLFESGDLDLLFASPLRARTVVAAKLVGIAATVALSFAVLLLPVAIPVAILGHPGLFGVPALLLALTLVASCTGLAVTLLLARIAGPRAARTVGQIVAALSGGAVFIFSQLTAHGDRGQRSGIAILFQRMTENGFATHGIGSLPGRAAFGELVPAGGLLAGALLLFMLTTAAMQTDFLDSYRAGTMKLGRTRRAKTRVAKHFRTSLFAAVFAKEWVLLLRDPALAFQIVLRLVYLLPFFLIALRPNGALPLAPSLAFMSVAIAGQVVGSFAWLAVSGEDTPDLIKVSPADKAEVDHAKLLAAMAMATPLFILLPIGIAFETIPGALVTLAVTAFAGWLTGQLEIAFAKPAPRSTFRRRQSGSWLRGIFGLLVTAFLGGAAAVAVYFL